MNLYDWTCSRDELVESLRELVGLLDLPVDGLEIHTGRNYRKRILEPDWCGRDLRKVDHFNLYDIAEADESRPWMFSSTYINVTFYEGGCQLSLYTDKVGVSDLERVLASLNKSPLLSALYGYATRWDWGFGPPQPFMFSVVMTPEDASDELLGFSLMDDIPCDVWRSAYMSKEKPHMNGLLRDVFELNFLSDEHLDADVSGSTLRQWIAKEPGHFGKLAGRIGKTSVWSLPRGNIEYLRSILDQENLLVAPDIGYL